jgi:hypothetical protein
MGDPMADDIPKLEGLPVVGRSYLRADQAVKSRGQIHISQALLARLQANPEDKQAWDELLSLHVIDLDTGWRPR